MTRGQLLDALYRAVALANAAAEKLREQGVDASFHTSHARIKLTTQSLDPPISAGEAELLAFLGEEKPRPLYVNRPGEIPALLRDPT